MNKSGIKAAVFGLVLNFILFLVKLYVGISSNSLSIYCDSINNLADTLTCIIALAGFIMIIRLDKKRGQRAESLFSFVIEIVIAVTGCYFVYNGFERYLYPLPIVYSKKYALLIFATIIVKIIMGITYILFNKKENSTVLKALILDSFLDCAITAATLMGLFLITKINFAADGLFAVIIGMVVTVSALKNVIKEAKFIINH